jgi:membrane protein DedA with SNARE-associated domain
MWQGSSICGSVQEEVFMFEQFINHAAGARSFIAGHPIQAVLALGLIFAVSSVVGETILYWMARLGGRPLVFRYSRLLRLDPQKIEKVEAMFSRWGKRLVFFGRFIPGVKSLVCVPAGMSRMNFGVYLSTSFSAAYIYNTLWFAGAYLLGHKITMFGVPIL